MTAIVLIIAFILLWKILKFGICMFFTAVCYVLGFMFALVVLILSSMLNVVTVPVLIAVYAIQKHRGNRLPYTGRWMLVFYPTFTDPKLTEEKRQAKESQKIRVAYYDWLTDPLYWSCRKRRY